MKNGVIVLLLIVVVAGGWYLYSQQSAEEQEAPKATTTESTTSDKSGEEKGAGEVEVDEDNPYAKAESVPAVPGPNEKIHEMSKSILTSVFNEIKLANTNSDSDPVNANVAYSASYKYMTPEIITKDQAGQIRDGIIEEGGEIKSTDVRSKTYKYKYGFEMDGKQYSANMQIFVGEEEQLGDSPQTIELDVRQPAN